MKKTPGHLSPLVSLLLLIAIIVSQLFAAALVPVASAAEVAAETEPNRHRSRRRSSPKSPCTLSHTVMSSRRLQVTGRIVPVTEQELFFRTNGRVKNVHVKRNDTVTEGQVLADLEMPELERQLERPSSILNRAKSGRSKANGSLATELQRAQIQPRVGPDQPATWSRRRTRVRAEAGRGRAGPGAMTAWIRRRPRITKSRGAAMWAPRRRPPPLQQATMEYDKAKAAYDADDAGYFGAISTGRSCRKQQVKLAQLAVDTLKQGVDPLIATTSTAPSWMSSASRPRSRMRRLLRPSTAWSCLSC